MEEQAYKFVNFLFDGKMVTSKNAFALGSNEYQMVKNMRYVEDGVVTRLGCSIHNSSDINDGSTTIKSITQMVVDRYSLTRTIVQADDLKYYYDDDLPTAGAFTGLAMYPTTEDASALRAISCGVGETEIYCNAEENWVYHGTQPRPTAIFHYDDSATSYISWIDEIYSLKTTDLMILDSMTNSDWIYLGFWVPFSGAYFDLTTFNGTASIAGMQYFNGGWEELQVTRDRSNGSYGTDDMADITDWSDGDQGSAVSSQDTFQGRSCMKLLGGTGAPSESAVRMRDFGTFGTTVAVTMRVYNETIGTNANADDFQIRVSYGTAALYVSWSSDGLFIADGAGPNYVEVGTNIVDQDVWTE